MDYNEFLNRIIDDGIAEVKECYKNPKDKDKLEGAIAGFEACRNLEPFDLVNMLVTANKYMNDAYVHERDNYWFFRYYQTQVEWGLNVVSAMLMNQGAPQMVAHLPTARGMMKAADILGITKI